MGIKEKFEQNKQIKKIKVFEERHFVREKIP